MARFTVTKRRPHCAVDPYPWTLRDAERPLFLGRYPSMQRAVASANRLVALEREACDDCRQAVSSEVTA